MQFCVIFIQRNKTLKKFTTSEEHDRHYIFKIFHFYFQLRIQQNLKESNPNPPSVNDFSFSLENKTLHPIHCSEKQCLENKPVDLLLSNDRENPHTD